MKNIRLITFSLLLATISGCSPRIIHFVSPSANFSQYSTYAVVNYKTSDANISREGKAILNTIESKISDEMERRNYENSNKPDLLVRYELVASKSSSTNNNNYNNFNPVYYPTFNNFSSTTVKQSAILIEIFNAASRKLLWQASVDMDAYQRKSRKEEVLTKAISNLFDTYLYRANSNSIDQSLISNSK